MTNGSRTGLGEWRMIALLTLAGTLACLALSLLLNYLLLFSDALTPSRRSLVTALVVPVGIAAPMLLFLGWKITENRRLRAELKRHATYDGVTDCYRGAVFSSMVERRVRSGQRKDGGGAFLIADAEHLNSIILRYGPEWGEEALRLISSTIRSSLRSEDMVGRLGTTEFGIFLHRAGEVEAAEVGRRIRDEVAKVYFAPDGKAAILTVRVGGVTVDAPRDFLSLFQAAQTQLSAVKHPDGVEISSSNPMQ